MQEIPNPNQYIADAECICNEQDVATAISSMSIVLNSDFKDKHPIVLSVMNGGIYFTGQLMPHLTFPLEMDYIHATRYQKSLEGRAITWLVKPKADIKDRCVLILDDILDEGLTLKAIVDACYLQGAVEVKVAVLVEKVLEKSKATTADYVGLTVSNRFIFGCGMDIHGWWRNLPEIYAVKDT